MTKRFKGKIALDIRDSEPDWEPFLPPEGAQGAPNVLLLAWDDVGYGTMDVFGGPVETPNMQRIADMGVRFGNFHTTALCSPTRASLLTGRNATTNGMATIAEFASGFPGISTRIPFESGFVSEVLAERGYNTYCVGKWHLTPGEECNLAAFKGRWPLGRGFERFYGWLGGETNSYFPDLVHDNHPIEPPARPEDGYHLADDMADRAVEFIRDAKVIDPDKPFFMYLAPQAGHAPHLVPDRVGRPVQGRVRRGLRGDPGGILSRQKELGLLPEDTELSPINPHGEPTATGPDGQPWPLLDTVRPWDSLTTTRGACSPGWPRCSPATSRTTTTGSDASSTTSRRPGELENTLIVVVSDNGASGEGGPNGSFNEWRFFNGVPDTAETTLPHIDELGTPASNNHYNTGWAWAFDTPFPYWKRWAGYEGGTADMCLVAWPAKIAAAGGGPPAQYVHAVDVVPTMLRAARHRAARGAQGLPAEPHRGRELRRGAGRCRRAGQADPVLHDARPAIDLPRGLARLHRAPAAQRLGERSSRTCGSCTTSRPTGRSRRTWRTRSPTPSRAEGPLVLLRRPGTTACRSTTAPPWSRCSPSGPAGRRDRATSTCSTRTAPTCPSRPGPMITGRSYTIAAGVTVDSADVEGVHLGRRRRPGRAQPLHQGRAAPLHVQLGRHPPPGRRRRPRHHARAARLHRRVRRRGARAPTRRCRAAPER